MYAPSPDGEESRESTRPGLRSNTSRAKIQQHCNKQQNPSSSPSKTSPCPATRNVSVTRTQTPTLSNLLPYPTQPPSPPPTIRNHTPAQRANDTHSPKPGTGTPVLETQAMPSLPTHLHSHFLPYAWPQSTPRQPVESLAIDTCAQMEGEEQMEGRVELWRAG